MHVIYCSFSFRTRITMQSSWCLYVYTENTFVILLKYVDHLRFHSLTDNVKNQDLSFNYFELVNIHTVISKCTQYIIE